MPYPAATAFLQATAWHQAAVDALPYDMSDRRYWRLRGGPKPALLMASHAAHEPLGPFFAVAAHLRGLGLRTPEILVQDAAAGFALIEDFGSDTFNAVLSAGAEERALYALAVDVLAHLHSQAQATDIALPAYGMETLGKELDVFGDWFLRLAGHSGAWPDFRDALMLRLQDVATDQSVLVLRDYHIDNLMIVGGAEGVMRCGLLDFQDALIGSPAYDMMSLVEDARRDVSPELYAFAVQRYLDLVPGCNADALKRDMALLGVQRHLKVLGVFTRYYQRTGRTKYLRHLPRIARLTARAFQHPALQPLEPAFRSLVPDLGAECDRIAAFTA